MRYVPTYLLLLTISSLLVAFQVVDGIIFRDAAFKGLRKSQKT